MGDFKGSRLRKTLRPGPGKKDGKYISEMKFRYRELIYRPDFYDFDKEDCTEWMPNGIYNYNVSRMIRDLACHEKGSDTGI